MSKFDKDSSINYEKMAENLKIVRDRLDCILVTLLEDVQCACMRL